ncbi:hypothetical protein UNSWCS_121 [Campylobacter concisus UNSWCS]|uniref:Uncharacterized protein n=1 Tax=Campylobacter concisus UNSWCS TaxID=1242968 RepID=U2FIF7_9BACT|nr:hypothetical protein [Campylobacter concisus]ERJ30020.1 hypothetical protein UNSWCS_121 [Campylobacter concisus UNSWCS]
MCEFEKQEAVRSFLQTELDKYRFEISVLEAKLKDANERKQTAHIIYPEVVGVETKDARVFLEYALKYVQLPPSDVVARLLKFMDKLDGADETPGKTATEAETKTAKDEVKADEKLAAKSPSQVLYETVRALRRFRDYDARRVVLALYGYFVTVEDDYSKRRS